jgi:ribosomal protein S12 methylthiotransferase accessory factor
MVHRLPHGSRVVAPEETERRLEQCGVRRALPITRVADLTPLDPLGIPVFVAVTPLARDLTTHAGKGESRVSARVSAMMEAVERISAEEAPRESLREGSFRELAAAGDPPPVDPRRFELPSDSDYSPERRYRWVRSRELQAGRDVLLPEDLVCSPARAGILREVDTNGLASGNTWLEAVVHGLCEVIERDLVSQLEFATLYGDAGELRLGLRGVTGLPDRARALLERSAEHGLGVAIQHVDSDLRVPTFRALVVDPAYPTRDGPDASFFPGFGTHPDAELALERALHEAFQSRVGFIHGGRDSFNTFAGSARRQSALARMSVYAGAPTAWFEDLPTARHAELQGDLEFLLGRLRAAGLSEVFVTDLTRADLGIPVVRVRVPGLAAFVVNRRRVGRRCLRHLV